MVWTKDRFPQYSIGEWTYGLPVIINYNKANLSIGKFCSIADEVTILLGGNHRTDWVTTYPFTARPINTFFPTKERILGHPEPLGGVMIGNDVWIGYGVTILPGVTIGHGAVIGARSVVSKNIPDYAIAGGSPIQIIRYRFSDKDIQQLLELKWWDWPVEKIRDNIALLCSASIGTLIYNQNSSINKII